MEGKSGGESLESKQTEEEEEIEEFYVCEEPRAVEEEGKGGHMEIAHQHQQPQQKEDEDPQCSEKKRPPASGKVKI